MFTAKQSWAALAVVLVAATAASQSKTNPGTGKWDGTDPNVTTPSQFKPGTGTGEWDGTDPGVTTATSYALCFGDGTGAPCPDGHFGAPGHGCDNSLGAGGGLLWVDGEARVSADTFQLLVDGLPTKTGVLYMQGTLGPGKGGGRAFGDGLMCLRGTTIKLGMNQTVKGFAAFPDPKDPFGTPIHDLGGIPMVGGTRYYQVIYRDHDPLVAAPTVNLTNAWMQVWAP